MPSLGDNKIEILLSATGSSQRDSVEVRRETEILIKLDYKCVLFGSWRESSFPKVLSSSSKPRTVPNKRNSKERALSILVCIFEH